VLHAENSAHPAFPDDPYLTGPLGTQVEENPVCKSQRAAGMRRKAPKCSAAEGWQKTRLSRTESA